MRTPRGRIATQKSYIHFGLTPPEKMKIHDKRI